MTVHNSSRAIIDSRRLCHLPCVVCRVMYRIQIVYTASLRMRAVSSVQSIN